MTLNDYAARINTILPVKLESLGAIPDLLRQAMEYSLCAGGKRLRPGLLLMTADILGGSEFAQDYACALEMIHTYSLIHDDLPAMDDDDLRRGRPTNHKVYGEGMAVLAGDGLLSAAMELMMRTACRIDDLSGVRATEAIARRCGVTGMIAGQVMDVTGEGQKPTYDSVEYIHQHKTADLIIAPLEAAAWLCHADDEHREALIRFGYHLGITFQIVDDLLDIEGSAELLGKQTGMDAVHEKQTWIAVRGIQGAKQDAENHIRDAIEALSVFGEEADPLRSLAVQTLNRSN